MPSKSVFFMMRRGSAEPIPRTTDLITVNLYSCRVARRIGRLVRRSRLA